MAERRSTPRSPRSLHGDPHADGVRGRAILQVHGVRARRRDVRNAPPRRRPASPADELRSCPAIGKTIAARIEEIVRDRNVRLLRRTTRQVPAHVVRAAGRRRNRDEDGAAALRNVRDRVARRIGARARRRRASPRLPRLGKKSIENIRRGILAYKGRNRRTPLGVAIPLARSIVAYLRDTAPVADLAYAGSLRRAEPLVGDIDIVCTSDRPDDVIGAFVRWERAAAVLAEGGTKARSGSPTGCRSTCACCRPQCTATYFSTSPGAASTTSSCANWRCARTCA